MAEERQESPPQPVSQRRRAQRRATVTLSVLAGFLVLALLFALAIGVGWIGGPTSPAATTTPCPTASTVPPTRVTVNVFNATGKDGLARAVAADLADRGFRIGQVSNDPLKRRIRGHGEIRRGKKGAGEAATLSRWVPGATQVTDKRKDTTVDLAIGERFRRLATPPPAPTPSC